MKFMDYIYKALGFETEDVKLVKKKPAKKVEKTEKVEEKKEEVKEEKVEEKKDAE